jgi:hypothetical protein
MMPTARRVLFLVSASMLGGCSVSPVYEVRVVNDSAVPVEASIVNTRRITQHEILASARVGPNTEAVLGPAQAPPLDQVELHIVRAAELGALPVRERLSRGTWQATVSKSPPEAWDSFLVTLEKD